LRFYDGPIGPRSAEVASPWRISVIRYGAPLQHEEFGKIKDSALEVAEHPWR
jgi:hypothetical protein